MPPSKRRFSNVHYQDHPDEVSVRDSAKKRKSRLGKKSRTGSPEEKSEHEKWRKWRQAACQFRCVRLELLSEAVKVAVSQPS